jgi:isopenicillin-N epimerase
MQNKFNGSDEIRKHWMLEEGIVFLNHGSFGATPIQVLHAQQAWQQRMERQPVDFFVRDLPALIREAATALAKFLHCQPEQLAFVENATAAVNAILRSYPWQAGDELLLGEHAYPAVKNAAYFVARQTGIVVKEYKVPFPVVDEDAILASFRNAMSPRTRMAVIDHVSSPLAIIYPVERMLAICREHGVHSLVDGAHAPGMLPLSIDAIGADYYVGNCHKWLFAPKGCAFLWASPSGSAHLQPLVISLRMDEGFPYCFDWTGTRDASSWLAIQAALDFYVEAGGADIPQKLHDMVIAMATDLANDWQVDLPADAAMFGAMVTLPVPVLENMSQEQANRWRDKLWHEKCIEVPFMAINQRLWVRISVQCYNVEADYRRLSAAISAYL